MVYTASYTLTDFLSMIYDLLGTIFVVLIENIGTLVTLLIVVMIVSAVTKVLKGTFNIFSWLK